MNDTMELRSQFAEQFLISPQDHDEVIMDGSMETLIAEFDTELAKMKCRYASLDTEHEWAEMDRWLSERGYVDRYTDPESR